MSVSKLRIPHIINFASAHEEREKKPQTTSRSECLVFYFPADKFCIIIKHSITTQMKIHPKRIHLLCKPMIKHLL